MQSRLIVKNFGPIDYVDLDLRNVNVFIGPQASGKSALAKLFTIFKTPRKFLKDQKSPIVDSSNYISFKHVLEEYNIASFLKPNTEIEFYSELHTLKYRNIAIIYEQTFLNKINELESLQQNFEQNKEQIKNEILSLHRKSRYIANDIYAELSDVNEFRKPIEISEGFKNLSEFSLTQLIRSFKKIEIKFSTHAAIYIPAERNLINIIKNAALNLLNNNVPIPKHILSFGAEIEKAKIEKIDLGFLHSNLFYKKINEKDRIFIDANNSIELTEAASGIQSVIPILIPIISQSHLNYYPSFVIEEPELNLFPLAQYELIRELETFRKEFESEDLEGFEAIHTYTTHSPYILSTFNNLLYANKVKRVLKERINDSNNKYYQESKIEVMVTKIVDVDIHPDTFTAYQISNGRAESIFNRETGLIMDNYIDDASDKMSDDFDALMNLMK